MILKFCPSQLSDSYQGATTDMIHTHSTIKDSKVLYTHIVASPVSDNPESKTLMVTFGRWPQWVSF